MNKKFAAAAVAMGLVTVPVAHAGVVEKTAFQIMQATGRNYIVPLKLVGGESAVICDPYNLKTTTLRASCLIRTGYPKSFCTIQMNVVQSGAATGKVLCGSLRKGHEWSWSAKYVWNGKKFRWNSPTRINDVPWPA